MPEKHELHEPIHPFKAFLITVGILLLILFVIYLTKFLYRPSEQSRLIYNNFEFVKTGGAWKTQWQKDGQLYDVTLRYSPKEVEGVRVSGGLNETFKRQPFYLTFDPEQNESDYKYLALGVAELGLNVVRGLGGQIMSACTQNLTIGCVDRPIVTCDDDDKAVVYFRITDEPRVRLEGNCLTIEGKELGLINATDRVLYHFYGIMP